MILLMALSVMLWVEVVAGEDKGKRGVITIDEGKYSGSSKPFKVTFGDGQASDWLDTDELKSSGLDEDAFNASGNREQTVMVFPSEDAVIVRLGWTAGNYPEGLRFRQILDAL